MSISFFFIAKIAITRKRYRKRSKSVHVLVSIFAFGCWKNYDILIISIVCREFDRCFGLDFCLRLFEKLRYFNPFDRMSGIRSASASRPNCQGVCPPLIQTHAFKSREACKDMRDACNRTQATAGTPATARTQTTAGTPKNAWTIGTPSTSGTKT